MPPREQDHRLSVPRPPGPAPSSGYPLVGAGPGDLASLVANRGGFKIVTKRSSYLLGGSSHQTHVGRRVTRFDGQQIPVQSSPHRPYTLPPHKRQNPQIGNST
jgi:hypothetical protein